MLALTVVVPAYRAQDRLAQAVASALRQAAVAEVVIVEDHSPDGSWELAQRLAAAQPRRIRTMRSSPQGNVGPGPARNRGARAARRPLLAFLDADDRYLDQRFAPRELALAGAGYAVCRPFRVVTSDGATTAVRSSTTAIARSPAAFFWALVAGHHVPLHTDAVTLSRELFATAGGFPALELGQDTALWWRIALLGRWRAVGGAPVSEHLRHPDNRSTPAHPRAARALEHVAVDTYRWVRARRLGRVRRRLAARALWFHLLDAAARHRRWRLPVAAGRWAAHVQRGPLPGPVSLLDWWAWRRRQRSRSG